MSAEWCEHDDRHLQTEIDGKHVNLAFKIAGFTMKEALADYMQRWGGVARLASANTVEITGPDFRWKLLKAEGNHGFVPTDIDWGRERSAGEVVRLTFVGSA